jgi:excisionase family DNA binding protein
MTTMTPTLLDRTDAAKALSISVTGLDRLIRRRELAVVRLGGRVLVRPEDLSAFVSARVSAREAEDATAAK